MVKSTVRPNNSFNASANKVAFMRETRFILAVRRAALIRALGTLTTVRPAADGGAINMHNWSDSKTWTENWITEQELNSGGQATAKLVRNKATSAVAFLKILSRQGDTERRARFFREATAYATIEHHFIPALIESNAHKYQDLEYKLYLIIEHIEGPTLAEYVARHGQLNFVDASAVLLGLLDAIEYCHANELIHRDIKPDNIILRNFNVEAPTLLDFGIAYKDETDSSFETDYAQELGNRFLRLPELSAGSTSKQDKRADISFLGGIFYYLLTGVIPSVLFDEEGRMPHQRAGIAAKLKESFNGRLQALLEFFDKSFSPKLSGRFSSAKEMKVSLESLINMHKNPVSDAAEPNIDEILTFINSSANQELARNKRLYDLAMTKIRAIHSQIAHQVAPTYVSYQTGYVNFVDGLRNDLGFSHFATHDKRFVPSFLIKVIGNELVVMVNGAPIYRTELEAPVFSEEFEKEVRRVFLSGLRELLEEPFP
jgi:serine/threonine-protein kinase